MKTIHRICRFDVNSVSIGMFLGTLLPLVGCVPATLGTIDEGVGGGVPAVPSECVAMGYECGIWELEGSSKDCGICANELACNENGMCETPYQSGLYGEVIIKRLQNLYDLENMEDVAGLEVLIAENTPLPRDSRTFIASLDGENCYRQNSPEVYPYFVDGEQWLPRPYIGIGDVTVSANGAPASIPLRKLELSSSGTLYKVPDDLINGRNDGWFEKEYMPTGSIVSIETTGDSGLGGLTKAIGKVPEIPSGITPALVRENEVGERPTISVSQDNEVKVSWTPEPGNHWVEIQYDSYSPNHDVDEVSLVCRVKDDGELVFPGDAVGDFATRGGSTVLMFRRGETRHYNIEGDSPMHLKVESFNDILGLVFSR